MKYKQQALDRLEGTISKLTQLEREVSSSLITASDAIKKMQSIKKQLENLQEIIVLEQG